MPNKFINFLFDDKNTNFEWNSKEYATLETLNLVADSARDICSCYRSDLKLEEDKFIIFDNDTDNIQSLLDLAALCCKWREPARTGLATRILCNADLDECDRYAHVEYKPSVDVGNSTNANLPAEATLRLKSETTASLRVALGCPLKLVARCADKEKLTPQIEKIVSDLCSQSPRIDVKHRAFGIATSTGTSEDGEWKMRGIIVATETAAHNERLVFLKFSWFFANLAEHQPELLQHFSRLGDLPITVCLSVFKKDEASMVELLTALQRLIVKDCSEHVKTFIRESTPGLVKGIQYALDTHAQNASFVETIRSVIRSIFKEIPESVEQFDSYADNSGVVREEINAAKAPPVEANVDDDDDNKNEEDDDDIIIPQVKNREEQLAVFIKAAKEVGDGQTYIKKLNTTELCTLLACFNVSDKMLKCFVGEDFGGAEFVTSNFMSRQDTFDAATMKKYKLRECHIEALAKARDDILSG